MRSYKPHAPALLAALVACLCVSSVSGTLSDRVSDALLLYYPFTEGSGSSAADRSAEFGSSVSLGWDAVVNRTTTDWVSKTPGIRVNPTPEGLTAYVPQPFKTLRDHLDDGTGFSLEVWAKSATNGHAGALVTAEYANSATNCGRNRLFYVDTTASGGAIGGVTEAAGAVQCTSVPAFSTPFADDSAHHVVFTVPDHVDGPGNMRVYVDGVLDSDSDEPTLQSDFSGITWGYGTAEKWLHIGSSGRPDVDNNWDGVVYQVAIYAKQLSDAEILQNYNVGAYNSPPVLASRTLTFSEDSVANRINITASDPDAVDADDVIVTLTGMSGEGSLFRVVGGVKGSVINTFPHTVTSGQVMYEPAADGYGDAYAVIHVSASDGEDATTATITINVINTNERPVLTLPSGSVGGVLGVPATVTGVSVADVDGDTLTLTVRASTGHVYLTSPLPPTVTLVVGSVGTNTTPSPSLQLTGKAGALNSVLTSSLAYVGSRDTSPPDSLFFLLSDCSALSANGSVGVVQVTVAPDLTTPLAAVQAVLGGPVAIAGVSVTFTDDPTYPLCVSVSTLEGSVSLTSPGLATHVFVDTDSHYAFVASATDAATMLAGLEFTPFTTAIDSSASPLSASVAIKVSGTPFGPEIGSESGVVSLSLVQGGVRPTVSVDADDSVLLGETATVTLTLNDSDASGSAVHELQLSCGGGCTLTLLTNPSGLTYARGSSNSASSFALRGQWGVLAAAVAGGVSMSTGGVVVDTTFVVSATLVDEDSVYGVSSVSDTATVTGTVATFDLNLPSSLSPTAYESIAVSPLAVAAGSSTPSVDSSVVVVTVSVTEGLLDVTDAELSSLSLGGAFEPLSSHLVLEGSISDINTALASATYTSYTDSATAVADVITLTARVADAPLGSSVSDSVGVAVSPYPGVDCGVVCAGPPPPPPPPTQPTSGSGETTTVAGCPTTTPSKITGTTGDGGGGFTIKNSGLWGAVIALVAVATFCMCAAVVVVLVKVKPDKRLAPEDAGEGGERTPLSPARSPEGRTAPRTPQSSTRSSPRTTRGDASPAPATRSDNEGSASGSERRPKPTLDTAVARVAAQERSPLQSPIPQSREATLTDTSSAAAERSAIEPRVKALQGRTELQSPLAPALGVTESKLDAALAAQGGASGKGKGDANSAAAGAAPTTSSTRGATSSPESRDESVPRQSAPQPAVLDGGGGGGGGGGGESSELSGEGGTRV